MSDQSQPKSKKFVYVFLILIGVGVGISLFTFDGFTQELSVVPADCRIIMNPSLSIPDDVVTKGYSIEKFDNGTVKGSSCYYLKDAGVIERMYYGWVVYEQ